MSRLKGYVYVLGVLSPVVLVMSLINGLWGLFVIALIIFVFSAYIMYKVIEQRRLMSQLDDIRLFFDKIENLELDFIQTSFEKSIRVSENGMPSSLRYISPDDMIAITQLNLLLQVLDINNDEIKEKMKTFLELRPTDPKVYRYGVIYMYAMLLHNQVDAFKEMFQVFDETLTSRTEYRVMNIKPGQITLFDKSIQINYIMLKKFYKAYTNDVEAHDALLSHEPVRKIDEFFYSVLIEHYAVNIENKNLLTDYEDMINDKNEFISSYAIKELVIK